MLGEINILELRLMPLAVIVTFKVDPAQFDAFKAFLVEMLPDTRAFDGCIGLEVAARDDDHVVILHEVWRSKAHQLAYRQWRADRGDGAKFAAFQREAPRFDDYEMLDIPRV
ncbi:MAG TPA: hypothetical protein DCZ49_06525 [Hyphomonadaceae bacterium]|nr:hypothetical protein [Hyphomonadaceae bacterium]